MHSRILDSTRCSVKPYLRKVQPVKARSKVPDEIKQLLTLVRAGKLFAVQDWIKVGKLLRSPEGSKRFSPVLREAVSTGFHSLVEELLRAGGWSPKELTDALELARSSRHFHVAELLLASGGSPKPLSFQMSCEKLDLFMMERQLREGANPNDQNVFAEVLSRMKARPLLGFYRQFRGQFPALDDQAALALAEAVRKRQVRWTALLAWAGADPFRPVPSDFSEPFPADPENCTTAANEAIWVDNPEIFKVLHLNPTPTQALQLLPTATHYGSPQLFRTLLGVIAREQINDTPRNSSSALENVVSRWAGNTIYNTRDEKKDAENLERLELLLDAGARWNPPPVTLRSTRRYINQHESRYIVQLLRLLLYTPNAADIESFLELCRSQTFEAKIAAADPLLVQEIKQLRKRTAVANASPANIPTKTVAKAAGASVAEG